MSKQFFNIKCGWGWTKAELEYWVDGVFHWVTPKGFRFISYDLEDTNELERL